MQQEVEKILETAYSKDIAGRVVESYREVESNYVLKKWKPSELDGGHFVESVRRIIEIELNLPPTPFGKPLPDFNEKELARYLNSKGDESFRVLIPRVLWGIYGVRSKRGVGHVRGLISANEMDSTLILYSIKWILSEIVRLKSNLSIPETQALVDKVIERQSSLIWKRGSITRVQKLGLKAEQEALILLLVKDDQGDKELFDSMDYANFGRFQKEILTKKLHKNRLITYRDALCMLTDSGRIEAEKILQTFS